MLLEVDAWMKARAAGITVPITIDGTSAARAVDVVWWNPEEHKKLMGDQRYCFIAIQPLGLRRDDDRSRVGPQHRLWRHKSGSAKKIAQVQRYPEAVQALYQVSVYAHKPKHARYLYPQLTNAYPDLLSAQLSVDIYGDGHKENVPINLLRDDNTNEVMPLDAERHVQIDWPIRVRTWIFHRSPEEMVTFWNRFELDFITETYLGATDTTESFSIVL